MFQIPDEIPAPAGFFAKQQVNFPGFIARAAVFVLENQHTAPLLEEVHWADGYKPEQANDRNKITGTKGCQLQHSD